MRLSQFCPVSVKIILQYKKKNNPKNKKIKLFTCIITLNHILQSYPNPNEKMQREFKNLPKIVEKNKHSIICWKQFLSQAETSMWIYILS